MIKILVLSHFGTGRGGGHKFRQGNFIGNNIHQKQQMFLLVTTYGVHKKCI